MDFDQAISAHVQWKAKLARYLAHPDGSLDPNIAGNDLNCDLGKWIHGEGERHAALAEYIALRKDHAEFHKAAAEVIRKADSGQSVSEEIALGSNADFGRTSTAVVADLMKIKRIA